MNHASQPASSVPNNMSAELSLIVSTGRECFRSFNIPNVEQHSCKFLAADDSPEMIANIADLQQRFLDPDDVLHTSITARFPLDKESRMNLDQRVTTPYRTSINTTISNDTKLGTRQIGFQDDPTAPAVEIKQAINSHQPSGRLCTGRPTGPTNEGGPRLPTLR